MCRISYCISFVLMVGNIGNIDDDIGFVYRSPKWNNINTIVLSATPTTSIRPVLACFNKASFTLAKKMSDFWSD